MPSRCNDLQPDLEIGGSHRLGRIADDLFVRPVVQIPHLAGQHDVAYNTAKADVERLMDANILEEIADVRQRTFVHDVAYNTAKADVERLMDANILEEIADVRQRTFVAPRIVAATFGDTSR